MFEMKKSVGRLALTSLVAALWLNLGATSAPPPPIKKTAPVHHPQPRVANPHLHGAKPVVAKKVVKGHVARH